jgi:hypothetical protein
MRGCRLKIPEACFECPYPDCINDKRARFTESLFIQISQVDITAHQMRRMTDQKERIKNGMHKKNTGGMLFLPL